LRAGRILSRNFWRKRVFGLSLRRCAICCVVSSSPRPPGSSGGRAATKGCTAARWARQTTSQASSRPPRAWGRLRSRVAAQVIVSRTVLVVVYITEVGHLIARGRVPAPRQAPGTVGTVLAGRGSRRGDGARPVGRPEACAAQ